MTTVFEGQSNFQCSTMWGVRHKAIKTGTQPNAEIWAVEPVYTNSKTLIGNWYEQQSKVQVRR